MVKYIISELRSDLEEKGYSFQTFSDTEVLINGYHCYGIEFIQQCIGMFAFALFDKRINKSYLVRDRLGIKPFYYCIQNGRLTFSSEIKSIFKYEDINKKLNLDAVSSFLSFRYPILDDTFFQNIIAIPPAHYIEIEGDTINTVNYWNPFNKISEQMTDKGEDWYISELDKLLKSSIAYRNISDVPLGVLLSGGVDSSIITALMSENVNGNVETFSIGYDDEGYNEFDYINNITKKFNSNHHQIKSSSERYFENLNYLIHIKDSPLSIPNEVTQYELCKKIKENVTVVLAGTGADEIFFGYGRIYRSAWDYERSKSYNFQQENGISDNGRTFIKHFKKKYGVDKFESKVDHFMKVYSYTDLKQKKTLLHPDLDLDNIEIKLRNRLQSQFSETTNCTYLDEMKMYLSKLIFPEYYITMIFRQWLRVLS